MQLAIIRYSTTGENTVRNIQPFFADTNAGGIGVAHNGNLTNSISLRKKWLKMEQFFIQHQILKQLFN